MHGTVWRFRCARCRANTSRQERSRLPQRSWTQAIGLPLAGKDQCWLVVVRADLPLLETAFFCDPDGPDIFRMDDASGSGALKSGIAPGDGGANGFCGGAFAVETPGEHPAQRRHVREGRL